MTKRTERHSFIRFDIDQWNIITDGMTRLMESVFFHICLHNWSNVKPVSKARLRIMMSDLPTQQWHDIIETLIDADSLALDDDGAVFSPWAMAEAKRAYAEWQARCRGGQIMRAAEKNARLTSGSPPAQPRLSPGSPPAEPEDTSGSPPAQPRLSPGSPPASRADNKDSHATNKEEEEEEEEGKKKRMSANALPREEEGGHVGPNGGEPAVEGIPEVWNAMASASGLSQVIKMNADRKAALKARVSEHGTEAIIAGIKTIPQSPFLMGRSDTGWKANFDWLLQPSSCVKLLEGVYHNKGTGKELGWTV